MRSRKDSPWWMPIAAWAGAGLVQVLGRSWRIERIAMDDRDARLAAGERCIFAFWHARLLPLVFSHRGRGIAVLVSRHRDGELISRILARFGFVTARGSSTRGGEGGVLEMLQCAESGRLLGLAPDGPRGPAERVKPGLVYLASRTGFPVIPVADSAAASRVLRSWDGLRIPLPFARVVFAYGESILVPPNLDQGQAETWRLKIENALHALTLEVARSSGEKA